MILWEELQIRASLRRLRKAIREIGCRNRFKEYRKRLKLHNSNELAYFKFTCIFCGDIIGYHLDFHHINPFLKEKPIISLPKDFNELKKCVPLCANCHRDFHHDIDKIHMQIVNEILTP